jgi:ATP synthase protein I
MEHVLEPDRNSDPLKHLEERIEAAKQAQEGGPKTEEHYSAAQVGWRMVTELVAGLGIGFGIGYGLDMAIGTAPFMMLSFTLLGFTAGVKTMMRSAKEIQGGTTGASAAQDDKRT